MMPSPGAANAVVPKNGIGMAFWIAGVPGSADMVKVKAPSAIAPGISRLGISASRNSAAATGIWRRRRRMPRRRRRSERAQHSTTEMIARSGPSQSLTDRAMRLAEPVSSISLPKIAPSMNSGKNATMKSPVLAMKICV